MVEAGRGVGLAHHPFGGLALDRLDRDPAAEPLVPGAMDGAVTASADLLADRESAQYSFAFDHGDAFAGQARLLRLRDGLHGAHAASGRDSSKASIQLASAGRPPAAASAGAVAMDRARSDRRSPDQHPAARATRCGRANRRPSQRNSAAPLESMTRSGAGSRRSSPTNGRRRASRRATWRGPRACCAAGRTPPSPRWRRGACWSGGSGRPSAGPRRPPGGRPRPGGCRDPSRRARRSRGRSGRPARAATAGPSPRTARRSRSSRAARAPVPAWAPGQSTRRHSSGGSVVHQARIGEVGARGSAAVELGAELGRGPEVVVVEEGDPLSPRRGDAAVAGVCDAVGESLRSARTRSSVSAASRSGVSSVEPSSTTTTSSVTSSCSRTDASARDSSAQRFLVGITTETRSRRRSSPAPLGDGVPGLKVPGRSVDYCRASVDRRRGRRLEHPRCLSLTRM